MKPITLPMAELKPALIGLGKLIQKSHGLPVLKTIKVERTAEGWVALTATDLDAFATVRLEQPAEGEALALLVPHEELARTVKTCAKDENILVAPGAANTGFIQYGLGTQLAEIEFNAIPVGEFPETPRISGDPIPLPEALRGSIRDAMECSSTDPTRIIINGVCIDVSNPKAHYVVGTDGRHLFSSNSFALPLKESLIIPSHKFLGWPQFATDGEWQLKIGTAAKDQRTPFQITSRRWRFIGHPREGNYPNWRQVVPTPGSATATVDLDADNIAAVLQTIQRMPCHDVVNGTIGLAITGGKFHLLGKSTATADWTRVPIEDAKCSGIDTAVFLNRELLTKALGFGLTRIDLIDARSPQRFSNGGRQMIVMPVRADASPAPATPAPSPAPESVAAQPNPPPQPAEQPKEETTMPATNGKPTGAKPAPTTKPEEPNGGYVCAAIFPFKGCLVGKVRPGTKIQFQTIRNPETNRKTSIVKVIKLAGARQVSPELANRLLIGQPQQGTFTEWRSIGTRVADMVKHGHRKIGHVSDLLPYEQEVMCAEFLRTSQVKKFSLPTLVHLTAHVGRNRRDIDVEGVTSKGSFLLAQVTHSEDGSSVVAEKLDSLRAVGEKAKSRLVLFCRAPAFRKEKGVTIIPIEAVFDIMMKRVAWRAAIGISK